MGNKVTVKERKWLELKLPRGAKPNHQFHVFNFINRTGHKAILHTVETMDNCRISYGEILQNDQFSIFNFQVKTNKLVYRDGRLKLVRTVKGAQSLEKGYKFGDLVTMHWGFLCEKINRQQARNLEKYTNLALKLANLTI